MFARKTVTKKNDQKLEKIEKSNFLTLQLTFLKIGGIIPSESILKSRWKLKIYNIYSLTTMLWYLPIIFSQFVAVYQNWGNISFITALIFEISASLNNVTISSYLMLNRKPMTDLITKANVSFKSQTKLLPFGEKHKQILDQASGRHSKFTWMIIAANVSTAVSWVIIPFLLWYTYDGDDIYNQDETEGTKVHWEFFSQRSWLPPNVYRTPYYQIVCVYQAVPVYSILMNYTGYFMFVCSLVTFAAAHFQILGDMLKNINKHIETTKAKQDPSEHHSLTDETFVMEEENDCQHLSPDIQELNLSENKDIDIEEEIKSQYDYPIRGNERQMKYEDIDYLVNCLKYHQAIIDFCGDIQHLFGPVLFILFGLTSLMMCITAFQATLPNQEDGFMKFLTACLSCWMPPIILCSYGEHLTTQSLEIQQRAYECLWYKSSTRFKKMLQFLIMRSQKPAQLNGGWMFPISLKGFADIANNVYAYFTILKQMQ